MGNNKTVMQSNEEAKKRANARSNYAKEYGTYNKETKSYQIKKTGDSNNKSAEEIVSSWTSPEGREANKEIKEKAQSALKQTSKSRGDSGMLSMGYGPVKAGSVKKSEQTVISGNPFEKVRNDTQSNLDSLSKKFDEATKKLNDMYALNSKYPAYKVYSDEQIKKQTKEVEQLGNIVASLHKSRGETEEMYGVRSKVSNALYKVVDKETPRSIDRVTIPESVRQQTYPEYDDALFRKKADDIAVKYIDKEYLANENEVLDFFSKWMANYSAGKLGEAYGDSGYSYASKPTDARKYYKDTVENVQNAFIGRNSGTVGKGGVISKNLASYLPQLEGQVKNGLPLALIGGAIGMAVGAPALGVKLGYSLGVGRYSYEQMYGASFNSLSNVTDYETAKKLARDEGLVSGGVETLDTLWDIASLGGGAVLKALGKETVKKIGKTSLFKLLGGYALNVIGEGGQESVQELISIANERRAQKGNADSGLVGLVGETVSLINEIYMGKNDAALNRAKEAGIEGMKTSAVIGGPSLALNTATANILGRNNNVSEEQNDDVYFLIEHDGDSHEYWQIESDKDIFKGLKKTKELKDAAYDYILHGYKGEEVSGIVDGENLKFIRRSAEEYLYGEASEELSNKEYRQKMRMSPSIVDLIENASIRYDAPDHKEHKMFPDGFKNYQGRVGIDDVIFRYIVRVGKARNDKIFYDINLEVDGRVPRAKSTSLIKKTSTSNTSSISQNIENGNKKISTNEDFLGSIADESRDVNISDGEDVVFSVRNNKEEKPLKNGVRSGKIKSTDGSQYRTMWTVQEGILDNREIASFYSKISEMKNLGYKNYNKTASGEYIFEIGNKLVVTDGDYSAPDIETVFTFVSDSETTNALAREFFYEKTKSGYTIQDAQSFIETIYGEGFISRADQSIDSSYERMRDRGREGSYGRKADSRSGKNVATESSDNDKTLFSLGESSQKSGKINNNAMDERSIVFDKDLMLYNNKLQLDNVVMQAQIRAHSNKKRLPKMQYSYTSDYFVVWSNKGVGEYDFKFAIEAGENKELISAVRRELENGTYRNAESFNARVNRIRGGQRSNSRDNSRIETPRTNRENGGLSSEQSESDTGRNPAGNVRNSDGGQSSDYSIRSNYEREASEEVGNAENYRSLYNRMGYSVISEPNPEVKLPEGATIDGYVDHKRGEVYIAPDAKDGVYKHELMHIISRMSKRNSQSFLNFCKKNIAEWDELYSKNKEKYDEIKSNNPDFKVDEELLEQETIADLSIRLSEDDVIEKYRDSSLDFLGRVRLWFRILGNQAIVYFGKGSSQERKLAVAKMKWELALASAKRRKSGSVTDEGLIFKLNKKWVPDLSKKKLEILKRKIAYDAKTSTNNITDTANWMFTNIDGTKVFAIYSTQNIDEPTLLYESKDGRAEFERKYLLSLLEAKKNGGSIDGKSAYVSWVSGSGWLRHRGDIQDNRGAVGRGRSDRDAGVLQGQSRRKPSSAFRSVIENLFEIQGADRRSSGSGSDRDSGVGFSLSLKTVDEPPKRKKRSVEDIEAELDEIAERLDSPDITLSEEDELLDRQFKLEGLLRSRKRMREREIRDIDMASFVRFARGKSSEALNALSPANEEVLGKEVLKLSNSSEIINESVNRYVLSSDKEMAKVALSVRGKMQSGKELDPKDVGTLVKGAVLSGNNVLYNAGESRDVKTDSGEDVVFSVRNNKEEKPLKNGVGSGKIKENGDVEFDSDFDAIFDEAISRVKITKVKMSVFPPYNKSKSDANERATRWAFNEDVQTGAQAIAFYHDQSYIIEKFDSTEFKYIIKGLIDYGDYQNIRKELKVNAQTGNEKSIEKLASVYDKRNRQRDTSKRRGQSIDGNSIKYRDENNNVQRVGEVENSEWEIYGNTDRSDERNGSYRQSGSLEKDIESSDNDKIKGTDGSQYRTMWTIAENVLTEQDVALVYRDIENINNRNSNRYAISAEGDYILEINNKLVYTDADSDYPTVSSVVTFDSEYEDDILLAKELVLDEERSQSSVGNSFEIIEAVYGEGFISRTDKSVDRAYERVHDGGREGSYGRKADSRSGKNVATESSESDETLFSLGKSGERAGKKTAENYKTLYERLGYSVISEPNSEVKLPDGAVVDGYVDHKRGEVYIAPDAKDGVYKHELMHIISRMSKRNSQSFLNFCKKNLTEWDELYSKNKEKYDEIKSNNPDFKVDEELLEQETIADLSIRLSKDEVIEKYRDSSLDFLGRVRLWFRILGNQAIVYFGKGSSQERKLKIAAMKWELALASAKKRNTVNHGDSIQYARKFDRSKKTVYNEYRTNALKWARNTDRKIGDVTILNANGKYFALIEATEDGFIELRKGNYEEVKAYYERAYRKAADEIYGNSEGIKADKGRDIWDLQHVGHGRNDDRNGGQARSERIQSDTAGSNEHLRNGNKGKHVDDDLLLFSVSDGEVSSEENVPDEYESPRSRKSKNPNKPTDVTQTQSMIDTSDILYVEPDKKRTDNWLVANRLQLPLHITNYGSIKSVTYPDGYVNTYDMQKNKNDDGDVSTSVQSVENIKSTPAGTETKETYKTLYERLGYSVISEPNNEVTLPDGAVVDGYVDHKRGEVYIAPDAKDGVYKHELMHIISRMSKRNSQSFLNFCKKNIAEWDELYSKNKEKYDEIKSNNPDFKVDEELLEQETIADLSIRLSQDDVIENYRDSSLDFLGRVRLWFRILGNQAIVYFGKDSSQARKIAIAKMKWELALASAKKRESGSGTDEGLIYKLNKKWVPDLSKKKLEILKRKIAYYAKTSTNNITDTANWMFTNIDGTKVFAIYSTQNIDEPTLLYEISGKNASLELDILMDWLEGKKNGESVNGKSRIIDRVSGSGWMRRGSSVLDSYGTLGRGRSDRDAGVLQGQSRRKPSSAFRSVIENLFEIQGADRRSSGSGSDRDSGVSFLISDSGSDDVVEAGTGSQKRKKRSVEDIEAELDEIAERLDSPDITLSEEDELLDRQLKLEGLLRSRKRMREREIRDIDMASAKRSAGGENRTSLTALASVNENALGKEVLKLSNSLQIINESVNHYVLSSDKEMAKVALSVRGKMQSGEDISPKDVGKLVKGAVLSGNSVLRDEVQIWNIDISSGEDVVFSIKDENRDDTDSLLKSNVESDKINKDGNIEFDSDFDAIFDEAILSVKVTKVRMKVFPPYNKSKSDANERATRWAHKEDISVGTQKLISYHSRWYIIEKFDSADLGYQIVGAASAKDINKFIREVKRRENGFEQTKQRVLDRLVGSFESGD